MQGLFKSREELVSMLLGLGIVLVVFFLVMNYFQKRRSGLVDIPGVTTENITSVSEESTTPTPAVVTDSDYVVIYGDSLWKIALKQYGSGYNWVDIAKANKLKNPGNLKVGQKLSLPEVEKRVLSVERVNAISGDSYVVVKGDSLSKIALRAYGDMFAWQKIWKANSGLIKNPGLIEVGWKLSIPR